MLGWLWAYRAIIRPLHPIRSSIAAVTTPMHVSKTSAFKTTSTKTTNVHTRGEGGKVDAHQDTRGCGGKRPGAGACEKLIQCSNSNESKSMYTRLGLNLKKVGLNVTFEREHTYRVAAGHTGQVCVRESREAKANRKENNHDIRQR